VAVTATEWRLALSRPLVGAGLVTIELRNKGADPHDLVAGPEPSGPPVYEFPETDPGAIRLLACSSRPAATGSSARRVMPRRE
jgi:hypothetical protein